MGSIVIPVWQEQYVALLRDGTLPATAAKHLSIRMKDVDYWRAHSEDFDEACKQAVEEQLDLLEAKAFKLAINGSTKTIYHQGIPCGEETVEHKDLMMFLLKAGREKYNDKINVNSKVDQTITIQVASFEQDPLNLKEVIDVSSTTSHRLPERAASSGATDLV